MFLIFRTVIISLSLALVLGACTSIEKRGLAKCSGKDRRPLNGDLWQWYEQQPVSGSQSAINPLNFTETPTSSSAAEELDRLISHNNAPHWNIKKSLENCQ